MEENEREWLIGGPFAPLMTTGDIDLIQLFGTATEQKEKTYFQPKAGVGPRSGQSGHQKKAI